ncbi:hypothetical protein ABT174_21050 [Streptomyces sparsogenes]
MGIEVSVGDERAQSQDGFGSGKVPAGAGEIEAAGDQAAAGAAR